MPTPVQPNRQLVSRPSRPASRRVQGPATVAIAPDRLLVAPQAPPAVATPRSSATKDFKAPGEDVRNGVSIVNMILGPVVTAGQGIQMLAHMTFGNPLVEAGAKVALKVAERLGHMPFLRQPLVQAGFKTTARVLPFISAALLCFDGYAMVHTLRNDSASGWRKAFTVGRFACNAIATAVSFVPGAGFVYALAPALVGNAFELAVMQMNAKGKA